MLSGASSWTVGDAGTPRPRGGQRATKGCRHRAAIDAASLRCAAKRSKADAPASLLGANGLEADCMRVVAVVLALLVVGLNGWGLVLMLQRGGDLRFTDTADD